MAYSLDSQQKVWILSKFGFRNKSKIWDLFRHSKATHLVNAGVNIYNVRDFLGHASVATTQVYLTSNPEVTRKAIEKIASQTVPESSNYYTETEKQSLMDYLETLI